MRLKRLSVKNFRCYGEELSADFGNLTAFIGKNDVGKSTLLEALEIFFNNETVKAESVDLNIHTTDDCFSLTCEFSDLPSSLTLDAGAETDLASEYLVTSQGTLKIRKTFSCSSKKLASEVFIIANHPTAKGVDNLLELKEKDLQALVKSKEIKAPLKGNPGMRKALWGAEPDLKLQEIDVPISKAKEDSKRIWEEIEKNLPMYALFQSDRKSQDSDGEVQNPMKAAITAALAEVQNEIDAIQVKVREKAVAIANQTHAALITLDAGLAAELLPEFTPPTAAKWNGLFSINMVTDGIPLNKRGSGVRRLVLVSFFKAEAERKLKISSKRSVIYAIEEPETSQHPNNQRILIEALRNLSDEADCQVILTTHSPGLAADLPAEDIRFISRSALQVLSVQAGAPIFGVVADVLGVTPDSRVKVLFCVEGPTDVIAFRSLSKALHATDNTIPDLASDDRIAFVVLGGGTLNQWVAQHYLRALRKPELHIYDSDVAAYEVAQATVNGRGDGSRAFRTLKHEIECYLHPNAIEEAFAVTIPISDHPATPHESVGRLFAAEYSAAQGFDGVMTENKAKKYLADRAFPRMTAERIDERDPSGEVRGWFLHLREMVNGTN
jgi:ABC-type cobalamin/Fe3+-siderophores transport system ATPase subunit